ncbi:MAG: hypothetical protein WC346_20525, partial [Methanogenium sp.]
MNNIKKLIFLLIIISSIIKGQFSGGDGSIDNPYLIETAQQLDSIRYVVTSNSHYSFKLINDIDLDDLELTENGNWETIDVSDKNYFSINLNGDFHVIKNLKQYTLNNYCGLFNVMSYTGGDYSHTGIQNLFIKNFNIIDTIGNSSADKPYIYKSFVVGNGHNTTFTNIFIDSSKIDLRFDVLSYATNILVGGISSTITGDSMVCCGISNSSISIEGTTHTSSGSVSIGAVIGDIGLLVKVKQCFAYNVSIIGRKSISAAAAMGGFAYRINSVSGLSTIEDCYFIGNILPMYPPNINFKGFINTISSTG